MKDKIAAAHQRFQVSYCSHPLLNSDRQPTLFHVIDCGKCEYGGDSDRDFQ